MVVTLYSAEHCAGCRATKKHLTRHGIVFVEIPIDPNDKLLMASFNKLGHTSAPIVCVTTPDGDQNWSGYRPDRIAALTRWV